MSDVTHREDTNPPLTQRDDAGTLTHREKISESAETTHREDIETTHREATEVPTQREDNSVPTYSENGSASTYREAPQETSNKETRFESSDGVTRVEAEANGKHARSSRLNIPEEVEEKYQWVQDLEATGGEADTAILRDRKTDEEVFFKYYRPGILPDLNAMEVLISGDDRYIANIIDYNRNATEENPAWEIQEYYSCGSLKEYLSAHAGDFDRFDLAKVVLSQVKDALVYLHESPRDIAHRDLKPANILLRNDNPIECLLTDFGLVKTQQSFTHVTEVAKGTWQYAAPEVHFRESSQKSEWFSLGAIVYEILVGQKIFCDAYGVESKESDIPALAGARRYAEKSVGDDRWQNLVDGLLTYEREHRWGATEIEDWLEGKSPHVYRAQSQKRAFDEISAYAADWVENGRLIYSSEGLADLLRNNWDDAARLFAGRPDERMAIFLDQFDGLERAAKLVRQDSTDPNDMIVRLQWLLDPEEDIAFRGISLNALNDQLVLASNMDANKGDREQAQRWLEDLITARIFRTYAEIKGEERYFKIDQLLDQWQKQARDVAGLLPDEEQAFANEIYMRRLPELFTLAFKMAGVETAEDSSVDDNEVSSEQASKDTNTNDTNVSEIPEETNQGTSETENAVDDYIYSAEDDINNEVEMRL